MAFAYERVITVTKSTAGNLSGFAVLVTLDTAALIAAGKMRADCYDLQVKDAGGNILAHWITPESKNTATTRIHFNAPTITGSGDTLFTMYYGDPSAANTENGWDTFAFFDDFSTEADGQPLNATRWPSVSGTWTVESDSGNKVAQNVNAGGWPVAVSNVSLEAPLEGWYRAKSSAIETSTGNWHTQYYYSAAEWWQAGPYREASCRQRIWKNGSYVASADYNLANNTYYTQIFRRNSGVGGNHLYYDYANDPTLKITYGFTITAGRPLNLRLALSPCTATTMYDYFFVKAFNEDTSSAVGDEQLNIPVVSEVYLFSPDSAESSYVLSGASAYQAIMVTGDVSENV